MDRYESIETLAVKLNQPKLYTMPSKGITTEDIAQIKYNEAQAYGFTTDEYGTLKTYLKNHKMKTEPSAISTSPVSPGPVMNHISNQNTVSVYPRQIHPEIQERRESSQELKSNIYNDCPRCKGKGEVQMWENVL